MAWLSDYQAESLLVGNMHSGCSREILTCSHFVKSSLSDSVKFQNLFSMFGVVRKDFF